MNWKEVKDRAWRELRKALGKPTQRHLVVIDEATGLDPPIWDCESGAGRIPRTELHPSLWMVITIP